MPEYTYSTLLYHRTFWGFSAPGTIDPTKDSGIWHEARSVFTHHLGPGPNNWDGHAVYIKDHACSTMYDSGYGHGCTRRLVRIWHDRPYEHAAKVSRRGVRHCPICTPRKAPVMIWNLPVVETTSGRQ